ncbi:MAG: DUF4260 family protein [Myxococcales bacterium]|nr:DUF4260 family protein [Myxococcales bacterium]MCB9734962.1 DUF4260 family protein [Deltaproteobacteria bacterium]
MSVAIPVIRRPLCASVAARPVSIPRRLAWVAIATAAIAALTVVWPGAALGVTALVAPDVPLLLPRAWAARGRLRPWAVPLYNTTHALAGPLLLGAVGAVTLAAGAGTAVLGVACAWLSHVTVDRALGYDLRDANGDVRG